VGAGKQAGRQGQQRSVVPYTTTTHGGAHRLVVLPPPYSQGPHPAALAHTHKCESVEANTALVHVVLCGCWCM
jgi:hypothetical protein